MNQNKWGFIENMVETGAATPKELVLFLLENYLLTGKSLNSFYMELCEKYGQNLSESILSYTLEAIKIFIEEVEG